MSNKKFNISETIEKLGNRDPDFRYMALSDLMTELEKDNFKIDADSERKICASIIKLLDDSSGDVQGLTVKCLGPLVTKIKEKSIQQIIDTLGDYVKQNKKENLRDIAGIGLKTVTSQIDPKSASLIIDSVTPKLLEGIGSGDKPVILETLGVLSDLLKRFSTLMTKDHENIQNLILPQLKSTTPATRKRSIACLGYLSISTPDNLFAELVTHVLKGIKKSKKATHIQTYISVVGAISRSVGYRLGKFLEKEGVIALLIKYLNDEQFEEDCELKDNCFQTFESLILRCPKEIKPYLDEIIAECLKYIQWDPNYAGLSDEDEEDDFGDEFDDDEFSAEEFSDDEDMSWKVRRGASKCLTSVVTTRPDLLGKLYSTVVPNVVARFKEREENVKLDIFEVFIAVLKQTVVVSRGMSATAEDNPTNLLKKNVEAVVTNLTKELGGKSVRIKTGVFNLLKELVAVQHGILAEHLGSLVDGIKGALEAKSSSSNLKIEVLSFFRLAIEQNPATAFHAIVPKLCDPILAAVSFNYYKISAEALRVTRGLGTVIRPHGNDDFPFKEYAEKIYEAIFAKYQAQDIDQEVKDAAIACMGSLIAHMGDALPEDKLKNALSILYERTKNEITRLTSVNVLIEISTSPLNIDLKSILANVVSELADFLRQTNRQLKQASLKALDTIARSYGKDVSSKLYQKVLKEASNLIGESDLHMSYLALRLISAVVKVDKKSVKIVQSDIYPRMLDLVQSSLLQGLALEALYELYGNLVTIGQKKFGFDELLNGLLGLKLRASAQSTKQSQSSIAQCVAALVLNAPEDKRKDTVSKFISDVKKSKSATTKVQSLLNLGEIGRRVDLSTHKTLQKVVLSAFDGNEDERNAASYCLGCVSVGNVEKFLPFLLAEIKKVEPSKQYLLIHSLKEIISLVSTSDAGRAALLPHLEDILNLLFENTESEEEGTRNVVAECLGKYTLISPEKIVPALKERQNAKSAKTRATIVTALKFAIVDQPHPVDEHLAPIMGGFLSLLADTDLFTRKQTLLTLNYAAHNKPSLIRPVLAENMEHLFAETKMKKELVTIVTLGPFKHKVDTGLENRKAAFECMYTLLETCIDKIEISTFAEHLKNGLTDVYDIKLLSYLMLVRLAKAAGPALITSLDSLVLPLKKTINARVRETAVQQEKEKNEELVRSACRAIATIMTLGGVDSAIKFNEFVETIVKGGKHAQKYEEIVAQLAASS